jgi:hypothetical protein
MNKDMVLVESASTVIPCKGELRTSRFPTGNEAWAEDRYDVPSTVRLSVRSSSRLESNCDDGEDGIAPPKTS